MLARRSSRAAAVALMLAARGRDAGASVRRSRPSPRTGVALGAIDGMPWCTGDGVGPVSRPVRTDAVCACARCCSAERAATRRRSAGGGCGWRATISRTRAMRWRSPGNVARRYCATLNSTKPRAISSHGALRPPSMLRARYASTSATSRSSTPRRRTRTCAWRKRSASVCAGRKAIQLATSSRTRCAEMSATAASTIARVSRRTGGSSARGSHIALNVLCAIASAASSREARSTRAAARSRSPTCAATG
mmetsp:Transcript_30656/g.99523  ORF Transcript_30656/g.99523 Transcript_30656/m.99523 type:complete len:250 (-) Transcript_30656:125-874(-)